ncbi:MAG: hypothetical protein KGO99_02855 [Actinomycetales bacterium]|nr:hypothetical protein [Actinomycetales bacterium]
MIERRASTALLIFIITAHVAFLLPDSENTYTQEISRNYSVTTCPGPINESKLTTLLPAKSVGVRDLSRKASGFAELSVGNPNNLKRAIVVAGNPNDSITIQSKNSKWTAAAFCGSGRESSWFVGGTADVTSRSKLVLVNSGLSDAVVEVTMFNETGERIPESITVKALSEKILRVDSLDPGSSQLVVNVKTIGGRVTSYLLDERVKGLRNLGGDFVSLINDPQTIQLIPGLLAKYGQNGKLRHTIRIMNVSDVDSTASVEIISSDGVYIPVGLSEISLDSRKVKEIELVDLDLGRTNFGLKIESESPFVASVLTELKSGNISDFTWSIPAIPLDQIGFNLYGLEPILTLIGEKIDATVEIRNRDGKSIKKNLVGDEIVNWQFPGNARLVRIINRTQVRGAMTWISNDGVTHLALNQAASLESATRPVADISVIQSR